MKRSFWPLVFFALLVWTTTSACTHVEYTRVWESGTAKLEEDEFGAATVELEGYEINEITWLDPTGVVCAGATTGLSELGAATSARNKAIEEGKYSYTYEYNVYAPVSGLYCGGYYRWGQGTSTASGFSDAEGNTLPLEESQRARLGELGFRAEGIEQFEWFNWGVYSFGFELAMGRYRWQDKEAAQKTAIKDYDEPFMLRMPLYGGLGLYPPFLFGFGVEGQVGVDLVAWALSADVGNFVGRIDYEAKAAYQLKLMENALILTAGAGIHRESLDWGEYWLRRRGPFAQGSISYVW